MQLLKKHTLNPEITLLFINCRPGGGYPIRQSSLNAVFLWSFPDDSMLLEEELVAK